MSDVEIAICGSRDVRGGERESERASGRAGSVPRSGSGRPGRPGWGAADHATYPAHPGRPLHPGAANDKRTNQSAHNFLLPHRQPGPPREGNAGRVSHPPPRPVRYSQPPTRTVPWTRAGQPASRLPSTLIRLSLIIPTYPCTHTDLPIRPRRHRTHKATTVLDVDLNLSNTLAFRFPIGPYHSLHSPGACLLEPTGAESQRVPKFALSLHIDALCSATAHNHGSALMHARMHACPPARAWSSVRYIGRVQRSQRSVGQCERPVWCRRHRAYLEVLCFSILVDRPRAVAENEAWWIRRRLECR